MIGERRSVRQAAIDKIARPRISTPMVALAWSIVNSPPDRAPECGRLLAQLILDAGEKRPRNAR